MKVRAVVATQDRPRGPHAPAMGTPRRTRHRADCAVSSLPENTTARAPWASAAQMPHSRRRGRWFPRAPPAPSSRQCANAALTSSGSISLPHLPGTPCRGSISLWCIPEGRVVAIFRRGAFSGGLVVARYRRDAFPGGDPWQLFRFMRSRRGLGQEKRPFLAIYRRHASKTSWLWQDSRAMHPKSPANGRSGMHRANTLPRRGPFRCASPSDHARRADLAVVRRLNEKGSGKAKKLSAFWQEHVQK